jgi:hypothetical protein
MPEPPEARSSANRSVAVRGDRRRKALRWLRRSYRVGAAVDAIAMLEMLFPGRLDALGRYRSGLRPDRPEFRYSMRSATLMAAWTALLLWADRDPLARKDVLPLTMAVVVGLMANDARAVQAGRMTAARVRPVRVLQVGLLALFGISYCRAGDACRERSAGCSRAGSVLAEGVEY